MAYSVISQNGQSLYNIKEYVLDTIEDLESLPVSAGMGSTAFVIEDGRKYVLNSQNQWIALVTTVNNGTAIIDDKNEYQSISNEEIDSWFEEGEE